MKFLKQLEAVNRDPFTAAKRKKNPNESFNGIRTPLHQRLRKYSPTAPESQSKPLQTATNVRVYHQKSSECYM